jgi:SAM-dependent methyltransferase
MKYFEKAAKSMHFYITGLHDKLLLFKYRGRPYLEYYRAVMKRETKRDPKYAVGGSWLMSGPMQLERLQKYGLAPHHTVLDIGCGSLRGGVYIIGYLDAGNYTGTDISVDILDAGKKFLKEYDLVHKVPSLIPVNGMDFRELPSGKKFDYLHAQSVLSHMPPEDIESLFANLHKVMHSDSQFLTSFFLSKNDEIYPGNNSRNFFYPLSWMEQVAARYGLVAQRVEDTPHYDKQKLLKITLARK